METNMGMVEGGVRSLLASMEQVSTEWSVLEELWAMD